jgi:hypothetical protein
MGAFCTCSAVRAEAGEVVRAYVFLTDVSVGANRAKGAEAAFVVWTCGTFESRVDVLIRAVVTCGTSSPLLPVVALWHFSQVVLV